LDEHPPCPFELPVSHAYESGTTIPSPHTLLQLLPLAVEKPKLQVKHFIPDVYAVSGRQDTQLITEVQLLNWHEEVEEK
jgi:hypothetical protein